MTSQKQTSGRAGSRAKTSASQASEQDSVASEVHSPSHSSTLWSDDVLGGWCWRTSQVSSVPIKAVISSDSSVKWMSSGTLSRGELLMLATSESPNDAVECSLSQVLNPTAPSRFSLSAKASAGILRRANRRGKVLPAALQTALELLAQSPDDSAKESTAPLMSHSSSVRRLTPTECERLMGWPDGWTISQGWKTRKG